GNVASRCPGNGPLPPLLPPHIRGIREAPGQQAWRRRLGLERRVRWTSLSSSSCGHFIPGFAVRTAARRKISLSGSHRKRKKEKEKKKSRAPATVSCPEMTPRWSNGEPDKFLIYYISFFLFRWRLIFPTIKATRDGC
ncbi:unnamed protein product, partial [Ixodes pacificus]